MLLGGGIGAVALGVTQTQEWAWTDPRTIGAVAGGLLLVGAALWRSARHPVPAIEISLWRSRTFAIANVASALYGAGLYAWLLLGVLFLTQQWHYSILKAGFASTPGALTATVAALAMGRLAGRWGIRPAVVGGALIMGVTGLVTAVFLPAEPHFLTFWLPVGLFLGLGVGATVYGTAAAAPMSVSRMRFAGATGLNTTARQLGGALGIAALAALLPTGAEPSDYAAVYAFCTIASFGAAIAGLWLNFRPPQAADAPDAGGADGERPARSAEVAAP